MRYLILLLCLTTSLWAEEPDLLAARTAQGQLGHKIWSRVVRIENTNAKSSYPQVVHALIFEFAEILWFYTAHDGTQSFSRYKGRLAEDKTDLSGGLVAIDPGFTKHTLLSEIGPEDTEKLEVLPNGCFITSIVVGWDRYAGGERIVNAKLLMYYVSTRRMGHCVFIYETPRGVYSIDSEDGLKPRRLKRRFDSAASDLALAASSDVSRSELRGARTLDFPKPAETQTATGMVAARGGVKEGSAG